MLSGQMPFDDEHVPRLISKITTANYSMKDQLWMAISDEAKDLITRMLDTDANTRPSASEVLGHSWFKKDLRNSICDLKKVAKNFKNRKSLKD